LRSPGLAAAFRYLHGWLSDGVRYLWPVCAVLLALVVLILLVAPPE